MAWTRLCNRRGYCLGLLTVGLALLFIPLGVVLFRIGGTAKDNPSSGAGSEDPGSDIRVRVTEPPLRPFPCMVATHKDKGGRDGTLGYFDEDSQVLYAWKDVTVAMRSIPGARDDFHPVLVLDLARIKRVIKEDPPIYFRQLGGGRIAPGYFATHVRHTFFQWKKIALSADELDSEPIRPFLLNKDDIWNVVEIEPSEAMIRRIRPR